MRSAQPLLALLVLVLMMGSLIAVPCTAMAGCCLAVGDGTAGHTNAPTAASAHSTHSDEAAPVSTHCGSKAGSTAETTVAAQLKADYCETSSSVRRSGELERERSKSWRIGVVTATSAITSDQTRPILAEQNERHGHRTSDGRLFQLNCAFLI